jgi:hypothetical protein
MHEQHAVQTVIVARLLGALDLLRKLSTDVLSDIRSGGLMTPGDHVPRQTAITYDVMFGSRPSPDSAIRRDDRSDCGMDRACTSGKRFRGTARRGF